MSPLADNVVNTEYLCIIFTCILLALLESTLIAFDVIVSKNDTILNHYILFNPNLDLNQAR